MHGSINTRDRYKPCPHCGRDAAYDMRLDFCTVVSCAAHFGPPAREAPEPRPPSTRELVEAERAVIEAAIAWYYSLQGIPTGALAGLERNITALLDLNSR